MVVLTVMLGMLAGGLLLGWRLLVALLVSVSPSV